MVRGDGRPHGEALEIEPAHTTKMKKLSAVVVAMALAAAAFAGEYKEISIKEVRALVDAKKGVIIDVNGSESYKKGHVPGALNYETVKNSLLSTLPEDKNTTIVAYCGGPKCRAYEAAAKAASELGYKNVRHFVAGISGWKEAGQPIEK